MDTKQEIANRAVANFKKSIPVISSFVSALTGKRLSVKVSHVGTFTDGKDIYIQPPMELGEENVPHVRQWCGERDETGNALCAACFKRESVLSLVYHEISHVIFESFDKFHKAPVVQTLREDGFLVEAKALVGAGSVSHLFTENARDALSKVGVNSDIFERISNAFEDIRVDARMARARPGVAEILNATRIRFMDTGAWGEQPLNAQAIGALICHAEDIDIDRYFDSYVVDAIKTDKINSLIFRAKSAISVGDSVALTVEFYRHMQAMGFFEPEDDDEDNSGESSTTPGDEPGESSSTGEVREPGGGGSDSKGGERSADGEAGEESSHGGESADNSEHTRSDSQRDNDSDGQPPNESDDSSTGRGGGPDSSGSSDRDSESEESKSAEKMGGQDDEGMAGGHTGERSGEPESSDVDEPGSNAGAPTSGQPDPPEGERPDPETFGSSADAASNPELEKISSCDHRGDKEKEGSKEGKEVESLLNAAIKTGDHFDATSVALASVQENKPRSGKFNPIVIPEPILGGALLHLRKALEKNRRSSYDRNRKSGRVDASKLGRRAWNDDERLFHRKIIPGKRDYAVVIGIDVSGSTGSSNILSLEKQAAAAQAELLHRTGVKFAVYAHSGTYHDLTIKVIKKFHDPWTDKQRRGISSLRPEYANYDGHTLEYYRKRLDEVTATDKILMYYSDGAMPAENYHEELEILYREINTCKKRGYVLMGVGIRNDDPQRYGMDMVRLDEIADVKKVVAHLGKRLEKS